jgi:hypothetical protein
MMMMGWHLV